MCVYSVFSLWSIQPECTFPPSIIDVALMVLCIPASSAAGERVFSALAHIWSDKRASLLMGRAVMLSFVYFNSRVIDRITTPIEEGAWAQFIDWMAEQPTDRQVGEGVAMEEDELEVEVAVQERAKDKKRKRGPGRKPEGGKKPKRAPGGGRQEEEEEESAGSKESDSESEAEEVSDDD